VCSRKTTAIRGRNGGDSMSITLRDVEAVERSGRMIYKSRIDHIIGQS